METSPVPMKGCQTYARCLWHLSAGGGIFILQNQRGHGASVFVVSHEDTSYIVALNGKDTKSILEPIGIMEETCKTFQEGHENFRSDISRKFRLFFSSPKLTYIRLERNKLGINIYLLCIPHFNCIPKEMLLK